MGGSYPGTKGSATRGCNAWDLRDCPAPEIRRTNFWGKQASSSNVKLRSRLTIGIEGKARLPYVETFRARPVDF
jgi:hypothetical protein